MVDVDSMSDAELRTKLIEFGFPVMPITGTTRKVMAKKLKILLENKSKVSNDGRRSLGKYSSEEESDSDVRAAKKEVRSRRITMAAPAASKVPVRRNLPRDSDESEPDVPKVTEEKKIVTRTTKITKTMENDFDTGSDTESEVIETTYKTTVNNQEFQQPKPSILPTSSFLNARKSGKPDITSTSSASSSLFSSNLSSPGRYTTYGGKSGDFANDQLNQIRSRLSLSTNYSTPYGSPTTNTEQDDQPETPFLSNFTRRLSQLSTQKNVYDVKKESVLENDTNGSSYTPKYMSRPVKRDFVRDYHQTGKRSHLKNNVVSWAVVAFALLFFIGLAILYMGMRDAQTGVDNVAHDIHVPYCDKSNRNHVPGETCVIESDLRDAVDLFISLQPELLRTAIEFKCSNVPGKGFMNEEDILKYIKRNIPSIYNGELVLHNMEMLVILNSPIWEVSIIFDEGEKTVFENPLEDLEELIKARMDKRKIGLVNLNPDLPWKCVIYNKLAAIFHIIVVCAALFLTMFLTNTGYKYFKHYQQKQKDELYYMVERIVDTLQSNSSEEGDNFLVINHVRDMIIPINDRPRMEKIWKNAIKFLNENESRVRTEMQVVQGEPYEVWRWLGSPSLNTSGIRNKSWQGQAFETQVGSVNSLPCSPTPCLKIRGMVDDGDRNLRTIREAVLSKCAHQCRILHCAVDTTSQCVYLKCANQADAAIAYRSLHGWWYAGNLVTVKYLRLERYMQRYPDSPISGPPYLKALQPGTEWVS